MKRCSSSGSRRNWEISPSSLSTCSSEGGRDGGFGFLGSKGRFFELGVSLDAGIGRLVPMWYVSLVAVEMLVTLWMGERPVSYAL